MAVLNYLPSFDADVLAIWTQVAANNPIAADRIIDRIYDRCLILADHPLAGRARPDLSEECRHLVAGHILILYRYIAGRADLVRAIDGRRDISGDLFRDAIDR